MAKTTRFEVYHQLEQNPATTEGLDYRDQWRWRLRHKNGNILADSGEAYNTKANAVRSIDRLCQHVVKGVPVEIIEEE